MNVGTNTGFFSKCEESLFPSGSFGHSASIPPAMFTMCISVNQNKRLICKICVCVLKKKCTIRTIKAYVDPRMEQAVFTSFLSSALVWNFLAAAPAFECGCVTWEASPGSWKVKVRVGKEGP